MKEYTTVGDIATRIHELAESKYKFTTVLRGVKESVMFLNFYSKSLVGIRTKIVKVNDNMTATLPSDCAGVTKVGKLVGKACVELDRVTTVLNKEVYSQQLIEQDCCDNCTCSRSTLTDPTTLLSAFDTQSSGIDISKVCDNSIFFNYSTRYPYLYASYVRNFGQFQEDGMNSRLILSGIQIGDELLVEYRTMVDAAAYQLVPQKAFDLIRFKCLTYLEPDNLTHVKQFQRYKYLFDTTEIPTVTPEQLIRKLTGVSRW